MKIIESQTEYFELFPFKSVADYYDQWETATPEVGKTYISELGSFSECHIHIISIVENIAIGKCVWSKIGRNATGGYSFYNVNKANKGWAYKDSRAFYRLVKEVK